MSRTGFDRRDLVVIALGGVLGAALRWWITKTPASQDGGWFAYAPNTSVAAAPLDLGGPTIPWRTLLVNLLGTFLLGAVLVLRNHRQGAQRLWLTVGTGFCGSLTTFSTFAVEMAWFLTPPETVAFTVGTNIEGFEPVDGVLTLDPGGSPTRVGLTYLALSLVGAVLAFGAGRAAARKGAAT